MKEQKTGISVDLNSLYFVSLSTMLASSVKVSKMCLDMAALVGLWCE